MKKISLSVVFLLTLLLSYNTTQAQVFVPKYLDLKTTSTVIPIFKAGDSVDLKVTLDNSTLPGDKTAIEYGVVRQIINGNTTQYEPISVSTIEKSYSSPDSKIVKINIPNTLPANSTSTYVFYAKTQVSGDADKENFVVSRQNFKIKGNDTEPLTKIKYINILQSNGERFALLHGPTIYDLSKTTYKGVASSTSLEITFESNTDTTLNPIITFSKLRSDMSVPDFKPESIVIKKGLNDVIIHLPTFGYDSGVYQGVLKLNNKSIPDVNFQYIVAGEMVTFSQPEYSVVPNSQKLKFNIYGTPMDFDLDPVLNNISTSSIEKNLSSNSLAYSTEFILRDNSGKELYKSISDVDFSTSTYDLVIPGNVKNIKQVSIKSTNKDGKIVYEGTKNLNIPQPSKNNTFTLLILVILLILAIISAFVFKQKYLKILIIIVALIILFLGVRMVAASSWDVPDSLISSESYNGDAAYYKQLTVNHAGSLIRFNTNIQTEAYDLNQDLVLTYQSSFESCNNHPTQAMTSLALYGGSTLKASGGVNNVVSAYESYGGSNYIQAISYQRHNNTYTSGWITTNLGKPSAGDYIKAFHNVTGAYGVGSGKDASVTYAIPLLNVTDEIVSDQCIDGKINHITTVGNMPYATRIIDLVATDIPCDNNTVIPPPVESTTTPPTPPTPPATTTTVVNSTSVCGSSVVGDGQSAPTNLCIDSGGLGEVSLNGSLNFFQPNNPSTPPSWLWSCTDKRGSAPAVTSCYARCDGLHGLYYCPDTRTCASSCAGDMCLDVPGIQTTEDPIWKVAGCKKPSLDLTVKLDKPYADTNLKCSVSWTTTVTPPSANNDEYTKCTLDGKDVSGLNTLTVFVGRHSIVCETKLSGTDPAAPFTLASGPVTKAFSCTRVPVTTEN